MEFEQESLIDWYIRQISKIFCNVVVCGKSLDEEVEQDHGKSENV